VKLLVIRQNITRGRQFQSRQIIPGRSQTPSSTTPVVSQPLASVGIGDTISQLQAKGFIIQRRSDGVISAIVSKTVSYVIKTEPNGQKLMGKYIPIEYQFSNGVLVKKIERGLIRSPRTENILAKDLKTTRYSGDTATVSRYTPDFGSGGKTKPTPIQYQRTIAGVVYDTRTKKVIRSVRSDIKKGSILTSTGLQ